MQTRTLLALTGLTLFGLILRMIGAQGDLWLDEIWSLELIKTIPHAGYIFFNLAHDNNHQLNSLYLYVAGMDASPVTQRGLSIVMGTLSIPIAAFILRREVSLVTAFLFATAYPLVHYGSEARGYAGMTLFSLIALLSVRKLLEGEDKIWRWILAGSVFLGLLSHFSMALTLLMLGLWIAVHLWQNKKPFKEHLDWLVALLAPSLLAACLIAIAFAISASDGIIVGGVHPFAFSKFVEAYRTLLHLMIGLPKFGPPLFSLMLTIIVAVYLIKIRWITAPFSWLFVIGALMIPLLALILRIPNTEFPRYFLLAGMLFLLVLAQGFEKALEQHGWGRITAYMLLASFSLGQAFLLKSFFADQRGSPSKVLSMITRTSPPTYGGDHDTRYTLVLDFMNRRQKEPLVSIPREQWCQKTPAWLIIDPDDMRHSLGEDITLLSCKIRYKRESTLRSSPLSGSSWALYRHVPQSSP
jgi:hypothetical protein